MYSSNDFVSLLLMASVLECFLELSNKKNDLPFKNGALLGAIMSVTTMYG